LRNISNNHIYTGQLTLNTDTTIGVDSGSTLGVTGTVVDTGGSQQLTKESQGTLILASANTYTGKTIVSQGALQVQHAQALGTAASGTDVYDGAQLQLAMPTGGSPVTVVGEDLALTGAGIQGTGALLNIVGNNAWQGPITLGGRPSATPGELVSGPAFSPSSYPDGVVAFGVTREIDTLTISGQIAEPGPELQSGLSKVGNGTLLLSGANTYNGTTYVNSGAVRIQNADALGTASVNAAQRVTVSEFPGGSFTVSFKGQTIPSLSVGATAGQLETLLNALPTIGGVGGSVTVTRATVTTGLAANLPLFPGNQSRFYLYTITFGGTFAGQHQPLLTALGAGGSTAVVSAVAEGQMGTIVSSGAALEIDGDPTGTSASLNLAAESIGLNGAGLAEVQQVSVAGTNGTFTLSFNGQPTSPLLASATAVQVQTALNGLSTIGGVGGSVSVSKTGNVFTITFGGTLGGDQPLLIATGTASPAVTPVRNGGAGALHNLTGNNILAGGVVLMSSSTVGVNAATELSVGGNVQDYVTGADSQIATEVQTAIVTGASGTFTLSFNGDTATLPFNATDNEVQNALNSLSTISGVGGSVLVTQNGSVYTIVFGGTLANSNQPQITTDGGSGGATVSTNTVEEGGSPAALVPVAAGSLTKIFPGKLSFTGANSYSGKTLVNAGILNIQNADGLGSRKPETQQITVLGASGTFTLTFQGEETVALDLSSPNLGADIETALNDLPAIVKVGKVTVSPQNGLPDNVFRVTFAGSLDNQDPLIATPKPGVSAFVTTIRDGGEGTVVFGGGTLQVQGGIIVASEALTINGTGAAEVQRIMPTGSSGSFVLNFNGQTTASLPFNATGPQVQAALEALSTVGTGNVSVTLVNGTFVVVFTGSLANADQSQITVQGTGLTITSDTVIEGGQGALNNGADNNLWARTLTLGTHSLIGVNGVGDTLTIDKTVTDNGNTFGVTKVGPGTLEYAGLAEVQRVNVSNTFGTFKLTFNGQTTASIPWNAPVLDVRSALMALSTIGSVGGRVTVTQNGTSYDISFGDNLSSNQPLMTASGSAGASVTPVSDGTGNTYTGTTTVNEGTLALHKPDWVTSVAGPLNVGDTVAPNAQVQLLSDHQIADAVLTTVFRDGTLDLNGHAEAIARVTILDGLAQTGSSAGFPDGLLEVDQALTMNGGKIDLPTSGGRLLLLTLTSQVNGTSSATGPATISGLGAVNLSANGGTTSVTFNVAKSGLQARDMIIDSVIEGNAGLSKNGDGRLVLNAAETYSGTTQISNGDVEVNGSVGNVNLLGSGASLSGEGTVNGTVTGNSPVVGTINPGDNDPSDPSTSSGTLTTGPVTLGSQSTIFVDLNDNTNPGVTYDVLKVNGDINLGGDVNGVGGAKLRGTANSAVNINDSFTIIETTGGTVIGKFNPADVAFIGGKKFTITYTSTTVVLTHVKAQVFLNPQPASLSRTSVFGESVSFTVKVTVDSGDPAPDGTLIDFKLDNGAVVPVAVSGGQGLATFNPGLLGVGPIPHTVTATFAGDNDFFSGGPVTWSQTVTPANTTTVFTSLTNNEVQTFTLIGSVNGEYRIPSP